MQFDSISAFFNMGGYAFYVWLSYGATALVLTLLVIMSIVQHSNIKIQIGKRQQREAKLRQAAQLQAEQSQPQSQITEPSETS